MCIRDRTIADGIHLGHGVMDLRYHAGGRDCAQPCLVIGTVNAKMQLFAMDVVVPGIGIEYTINDFHTVSVGVHKGFAPPGPGTSGVTDKALSVTPDVPGPGGANPL